MLPGCRRMCSQNLLKSCSTVLPASVLEKLNAACAAGLTNATLREKFLKAGMRAWEGPNTPGTTAKIVADELSRFKRVSERTGIKIQGG